MTSSANPQKMNAQQGDRNMRKIIAIPFAFGALFTAAWPVTADAQQANAILKRVGHIEQQRPPAYPQDPNGSGPIWSCAYINGQRDCPHDGTLM
jgi:hypothetical protein